MTWHDYLMPAWNIGSTVLTLVLLALWGLRRITDEQLLVVIFGASAARAVLAGEWSYAFLLLMASLVIHQMSVSSVRLRERIASGIESLELTSGTIQHHSGYRLALHSAARVARELPARRPRRRASTTPPTREDQP